MSEESESIAWKIVITKCSPVFGDNIGWYIPGEHAGPGHSLLVHASDS